MRLFSKIAIAIIISASVNGASPRTVLSQFLEQASALENDVFLRDFPYDAYLASCNVANFSLLEEDRSLLNDTGRNGDTFLTNLFMRYLLLHSPNLADHDDVKRLFNLADGALAYRAVSSRRPEIYQTIGYLILDDLDARVKMAISSHRLLKDSREAPYLLKALAERGYHIGFPVSRLEKFIQHAMALDLRYIADRVWKEAVQYRSALIVIVAMLVGLRWTRLFGQNFGTS